MFSSFLSTIRGGMQSPKSLLASYLASYLGRFFEVDPAFIQSNLLKDTKILLKNLRLKPFHWDQVTLDGSVAEIEFSWTWGGDGTTQFVRDVILTIRGVSFRIRPKSEDLPLSTAAELLPLTPTASVDDNAAGYLQRAMDQVLDHLTLHVVDVKLTIETPQEDYVLIQSEELKLSTYGKDEQGLSQRISFSHLTAHVIDSSASDTGILTLLESVSYSALVTRSSGRRFLDGVRTGLHVHGGMLPGEDSTDVVVHGGCTQARTLSHVAEMFLAPPERELKQASIDCISSPDNVAPEGVDRLSSVVILPLPSLWFLLPNDTKIHMPNGTFSCRMDGSMCELSGARGIYVNECYPLLSLDQGVEWKLDAVKSRVSLQYTNPVDVRAVGMATHRMASFTWNETEVKKFFSSIQSLRDCTSTKVVEELEDVVARELEAHVHSAWSFCAPGVISLRIQGSYDESIEALLSEPSFSVSPVGSLSDFSLSRLTMGPTTSFGSVDVRIPKVVLVAGELCLDEPVQVVIESTSVAKNIGRFLQRFMDTSPLSTSRTINRRSERSVGIRLRRVDVMLLESKGLQIEITGILISKSLEVHMDKVAAKDASDMVAVCSAVDISVRDHIECSLAEIEMLKIPGLITLENPVKSAAILFVDGTLELFASSIEVSLLSTCTESHVTGTGTITASNPVILPFPCRLKSHKIMLFPSKAMNAHVVCHHIDVSILSLDNSLLVKTQSDFALRIQGDVETWVEASFDSIDATLRQKDGDAFEVHSFRIQRTVVSSSQAIGDVHCTIPATTFTGADIAIDGNVAISMESCSAVQAIQKFVASILPRDGTGVPSYMYAWDPPFGVPVTAQEVALHIDDNSAIDVRIVGAAIGTNVGYCSSIMFNDGSGHAGSVSDVTVTGGSEIAIELGQLDSFQMANVFSLTSPTKIASLVFSRGVLTLRAGVVSITLNQDGSKPSSQTSSPSIVPSIPFEINVFLDEASIKSFADAVDVTELKTVELCAGPIPPDVFEVQSNQRPGSLVRAKVGFIKNSLMEVSTIRASGTVLENTRSVQNFLLSISNTTIVAGFTNLDWSAIIRGGQNEGQGESQKIDMPFARVDAMCVHVSFKGNVVETSTSINIPTFVGDSTTTTTEILDHFKASISKKVPSFIANVDILGESLVDRTAKSAGLLAMSKSLTGSAVGSVSGLVAVDGIRGAIRAGKDARGADKDDAYRFGDFTRGSIRSLGHATQRGAELRRGDSSRYEVGDLTTGVVSSAGQYVCENKARLGSAGAGGVGMMIGLAVAGPIGLVAGSYLGSRAGRSTFEGAEQSNDSSNEALSKSAIDNDTIDLQSDGDADLLGFRDAGMSQCQISVASREKGQINPAESHFAVLKQRSPLVGYNTATHPFDSNPTEFIAPASHATMKNAEHLVLDSTIVTKTESQQVNSYTGKRNPDADGSVVRASHSDVRAHRTTIQQHAPRDQQQNKGESDLNYHSLSQGSPPATANRQQVGSSTAQRQQLNHSNEQQQQSGYRFGDLTRSVIEAGKAKDGRKGKDGYKFGDFTRGLFSG